MMAEVSISFANTQIFGLQMLRIAMNDTKEEK